MTPSPTSLHPDRARATEANDATAPPDASVACGPAPDSPLVDWQAFEDEYDRQERVVDQLVSTVIRSRSGDPDKLRIAAGSGDVATIGFVAHGLKTVGGLIKCQRLRDVARHAERAALEGTGDVGALALELAETLDRMLSELKARVASVGLP